MAFKLVKDPDDSHIEFIAVSSLTQTAGNVLELDVGATTWTAGDTNTQEWQQKVVLAQDVVSTDTEVKAWRVHPGQVWEADCTNNSSASHDGDRMLLTNASTVNNAGADATSQSACVVQIVEVGATADNLIQCRFLNASGINPDAA